MVRVYVVIAWFKGEADVLAVFSNEDDANSYVAEQKRWLDVPNVEIGFGIESLVLDAEKIEQTEEVE